MSGCTFRDEGTVSRCENLKDASTSECDLTLSGSCKEYLGWLEKSQVGAHLAALL